MPSDLRTNRAADQRRDNSNRQGLHPAAPISLAHPRSIAEAIVRAILLGRSTFSVSTDRKAMDRALDKFLQWTSSAEEDIRTAISESAFGTGYEEALKREVYFRLGIHPLTGAKVLPEQISL